MMVKRIAGSLVALSMLLGGGSLALVGLGYLGRSEGTSPAWALTGALLAGWGIALLITLWRRR